jgi:zinc protease
MPMTETKIWLAALTMLAACATTKSAPRTSKPAPVAAADPDAAPLPLWPEIHTGTLPNGLTYYILKHDTPKKRARFWLAVNAGSMEEDDDQRGLAHFDEHMAFNGTKSFPKSAIVDYLEKIGMRFGADLNAYTSFDETVYQLEVPTDQPGFVDKGLDILREWAGRVSYDPGEVDKERGVVHSELRLGLGAMKRIRDKQEKVFFAGTRYAERDTIGLAEIIDHAPADKLVRFYKDWYRPELMAVLAVGDFDVASVESEIRARFGDLKAAAPARARPTGGVPPANGTRYAIDADKEVPATVVSVSNLIAHRSMPSRRDYRRYLLESVYAAILNERFRSIAKKPGAPFVFAGGGVGSDVRDVDDFRRFAMVKGDEIEGTLRALLTEVLRIERHGVTAPELDRARANMARAAKEMAETDATHDSRERIDEMKRHFLTGEPIIGAEAEAKLMLDMLPTVTVAELDAVMKPFQGGANRVISIVGPDAKRLPDEAKVRALVDSMDKADVPAWEEKATKGSLMEQPPTPGKIVAEKRVPAVDVTEWTLSNGVRVIVKPTDYQIDAVTIRGESPGGSALASDADFLSAQEASSIVQASGVGSFDEEALGKLLTGKQAVVFTHIGEVTEGVDALGSVHDLETTMQLIYLKMTAPRKDQEAFDVWKANASQMRDNMLRTPEVSFALDAQDAVWKHQLRRRSLRAADVQAVDLDKALAFYRQRFGDASDFTFVIVGAVKLDALRPLVETYLASLPAHGRKEKERDLGLRRVAGVFRKEWKRGQEPKAQVSMQFHAEEPWSRDKSRDIAILDQVLTIRLREVLREDLGGVYGVGVGGAFTRSPHPEHVFDIHFGCDPKRVEELKKATHDVIAELQHDGASEAVLEKVRAAYQRQHELDQRSNVHWARQLSGAYRYGDDPTIGVDPAPMLARMTSPLVKASAKHYLDGKQYIELVLRPE